MTDLRTGAVKQMARGLYRLALPAALSILAVLSGPLALGLATGIWHPALLVFGLPLTPIIILAVLAVWREGEETGNAEVGRVRVKPLEWGGQTEGDELCAAEPPIFPRYAVLPSRRGGYYARTGTGAGYFDGQPHHTTLEAAKAACQRDYETRILSCLEGTQP